MASSQAGMLRALMRDEYLRQPSPNGGYPTMGGTADPFMATPAPLRDPGEAARAMFGLGGPMPEEITPQPVAYAGGRPAPFPPLPPVVYPGTPENDRFVGG